MAPLVRAARPRQYLKNVLVFGAPGAAGVLTSAEGFGRTVFAFIVMCLAASGTYFWNDILDLESDRAHPTKSKRPIAAGAIGIGTAKLAGTVLLAAVVPLSLLINWQLASIVATYVVLTTSYSAIWKHIAVLDIVAIASGFFLRAAAGAVATGVGMSSWFILVTVFGSLFIVTGKRYAEARELGDEAGSRRATLAEYTPEYLRFVLAITCGCTLISYSMWAFEAVELADHDWPLYEASVAPVIAALLRYALVIDTGGGSAPEDVFLADRVLQLLGSAWLIIFAGAVYL